MTYKNQSSTLIMKKEKKTPTFGDYILGALVITMIVTILMTAVIPNMTSARERTNSTATYEHLMNGTFYNDGSVNLWSTRFENLASLVLKVVLPFMTVYAITIMVISMSSTVIYLSKPDFFDEVHEHHIAVAEMKKSRMGLQKGLTFVELALGTTFSGGSQASTQNYGEPSFIKGVIIPDFKEMAFYEAAELGKDGRPSMGTFMKHNMPKYMAIMALIIMINDRTLLDLYVAGAEIGVFFTQKLAYDFNYPELIQRAMATGKKYDPGWKGGKADTFNKVYTAALQEDKSPGTETEEYKQTVGALVARAIEEDVSQYVDFENYKTASHVRLDTIPYPPGQVPQGSWQWPLSKFGVNTGNMERYVTLSITMTDKNKSTALVTAEETTYAEAWDINGGTVRFDLNRTDIKTDPNSGRGYANYRVDGRPTVHIIDRNRTIRIATPAVSKDGIITFQIPNLGAKEDIAKITFSIRPESGSVRTVRYVNNSAINKELQDQETNSPINFDREEHIPNN